MLQGPDSINRAAPEAARRKFLTCCGSQKWSDQMLALRPFADEEQLLQAAGTIWERLSPDDWLEAFAQHPKIGAVDSQRTRFPATGHLAMGEQRGVAAASDGTLAELAAGNRRYQDRYGYIYIVSATGKSAGQLLANLKERLVNDPDTELQIAAREQLKITRLRLRKLIRI